MGDESIALSKNFGSGHGDGHSSECRLGHILAWRETVAAVGRGAAAVLQSFLIEERSLRAIGLRRGVCHKTAKRIVCKHDGAPAIHYAEVDNATGRSSTPATWEVAIRLVALDKSGMNAEKRSRES